ncbi:hypothetical protein PRUPE_7G042700 [Prunus persica]|uniref:Uncharacterized protein n=1 Tax=Prunus persica TaxID=3760 RepID=A0A251N6J4_PRUPE|nr:hypothetical protein PRUPE_7G042700 [Prunus persica]
MKGNSGSPCLRPLAGPNLSLGLFTPTSNIHFLPTSPKPFIFRNKIQKAPIHMIIGLHKVYLKHQPIFLLLPHFPHHSICN